MASSPEFSGKGHANWFSDHVSQVLARPSEWLELFKAPRLRGAFFLTIRFSLTWQSEVSIDSADIIHQERRMRDRRKHLRTLVMPSILLVEDSEEIWPLRLIVHAAGYHVICAENGEAAFALAGRQLPDLIVTDWNMPVLDGEGLCRRLKRYPALSQIPIVVVSAVDASTVDEGLRSAFLHKPVDPQELTEAISMLVAGRSGAASQRTAGAADSRTESSHWQTVSSKWWI
jgi:CheY-like chemotaxis protein